MNHVTDMTEGNSRKLILSFFFPMLITNMLQQFYSFVDTMLVGKGLGDNALAAVGNMGSLTFLIFGFSIGLANGFSVIIAQHFGAKRYEELRHSMAALIKLSAIIAVVLTTVSLLSMHRALLLLRTDSGIMKDSLTYGYVIFGGLVAPIAYNMSAFILRSFGDSKTPLYAIIVSSVLNIFLDWFFIFILHSGVEGAAIATIISQLVSASICISRIRRIEFVKLRKEDFTNPPSVYGTLLKNGIPMACMNSITAVGCMVVQYFVNGFGVDYTAAYAACGKYLNLFMQPACTAGSTMAAFTSQNTGAKRFDRVREGLLVCMGISIITYLLLGSFMVFAPRFLAGLLLTGEASIQLACEFLPICGIMIISVDLLFTFRSGVQGMGYPFIPMCSGILEMVMRIGIIVLLSGTLGFKATAFAEAGAWTAALILNIIAFINVLHAQEGRKEKLWKTSPSTPRHFLPSGSIRKTRPVHM